MLESTMNRLRENITESSEPQIVVQEKIVPSRKKKRWKIWLFRSTIFLGVIAVLSVFIFAGNQQKATTIWKLDIEVKPVDGLFFITPTEVKGLIQTKGDSLVGKKVANVDMESLHTKLSKHPCVRSAEVYATVDGRCVIKVEQRQPLARVFNQDGTSFFIDLEGWFMPYTGNATMNLPLFVGNIQEKIEGNSILELRENEKWAFQSLADDIYFLAYHIQKDEFLSAQVDHVYIDPSRNVQLIPRVGDHRIYLGEVKNLEKKFKKLMAFYASALQTHDLNNYKSIHLEYEGQVVCEKKI